MDWFIAVDSADISNLFLVWRGQRQGHESKRYFKRNSSSSFFFKNSFLVISTQTKVHLSTTIAEITEKSDFFALVTSAKIPWTCPTYTSTDIALKLHSSLSLTLTICKLDPRSSGETGRFKKPALLQILSARRGLLTGTRRNWSVLIELRVI